METISQEKQQVLDRALANPTDSNSAIIIQKAKDRGWLKIPETEPTTDQKVSKTESLIQFSIQTPGMMI